MKDRDLLTYRKTDDLSVALATPMESFADVSSSFCFGESSGFSLLPHKLVILRSVCLPLVLSYQLFSFFFRSFQLLCKYYIYCRLSLNGSKHSLFNFLILIINNTCFLCQQKNMVH